MKDAMVVSFSGGRTSAYMSYILKRDYSDLYDFTFIFANTGLEREETLRFVNQCSTVFGLDVVWVEAVVNPKHGVGVTHKVVDFATASRNGEPFEAHIAKSGIPNANKPQCSDRLKALPIEHYKKLNGLKGAKHCIGIRADEERRRSKNPAKYNLVYPLLDWLEADKQDVNTFFEGQFFNLELEEHQGNCATCWKKSNPKLWLTAIEEPGMFDFMREMEEKYPHIKPNEDGRPRVFFRGHRSVRDLMTEASEYNAHELRKKIGYEPDSPDGCSSSCEAYA